MTEQEERGIAVRAFFRLFQVGNILQRAAQKEVGISTVQWAVLGALSRRAYRRGMSFNELNEYLRVSRQSLDGVLKRLERDKHVVRIPHPEDRRARLVQLTEKGKKFWSGLKPLMDEFYRQGLSGFSFDDAVSFVHFLNRTKSNLEAVRVGGTMTNHRPQKFAKSVRLEDHDA